MPKKSKKRPRAKRPKRPSQSRANVIHPVNPPHQYHAVHHSALKNFARDTAHHEKIKTRLEKDDTLSEHKIKDLKRQQRELIKH